MFSIFSSEKPLIQQHIGTVLRRTYPRAQATRRGKARTIEQRARGGIVYSHHGGKLMHAQGGPRKVAQQRKGLAAIPLAAVTFGYRYTHETAAVAGIEVAYVYRPYGLAALQVGYHQAQLLLGKDISLIFFDISPQHLPARRGCGKCALSAAGVVLEHEQEVEVGGFDGSQVHLVASQ